MIQRVRTGNQIHIELIYQSVPGIGEISARVLANELGDIIGKIRACFKEKSPYKVNISKIRSIKMEEKH